MLRALRQRAALDGLHQLVDDLSAVEQRNRHQIEYAQAHADDGEEADERRQPEIGADARKLRDADRA